MSDYKPTLILDFDGVIHSYTSGWKGADVIPDDPVGGAFEAIEGYLDAGLKVAVFSSRTHQKGGLDAMKKWFRRHGLKPELHARITFPNHRPPAILSIDDRAIQFKGWWPTPEDVKMFKTWQEER